MNRKRSKGWNFVSFILLIYVVIVLFLLLSTVFASFKTKSQLAESIVGIPNNPTLNNYIQILFVDGFLKYMLNSVILTCISVAAVLMVSSMTAYGLARYRFKGRYFLQMFFLLGLMFPIQLGILPNFLLLNKLGLVNTFAGMVLLYSANISFPFFIFFKAFQKLPASLEEAARIDGANEFSIYFRVMLPIARPVFITVGLITFVNLWNDFYLPLVFLSKDNVKTMTLAIQKYLANFLKNWDLVFPAVVLGVLPLIIIFIFGADKIVEGLTAGSTKE